MAWGDPNSKWGTFKWGQRFPVESAASTPFEAGISTAIEQIAVTSFEATGSGRIRRVGPTRGLKLISAALVDIGFELGSNPFLEERLILVDAGTFAESVVVGLTDLGLPGTVTLQPSVDKPLIIASTEELAGGVAELDAGEAVVGFRITVSNVRIIRVAVENAQTAFVVEGDNVLLEGVRGGSVIGISAENVTGLDILNAILDPDQVGIDLDNVSDFLIAHCSIRVASRGTQPAAGISLKGSDGGVEANVVKVRKVEGDPTVCISISDSLYLVVDGNVYKADQGAKIGRIEFAAGSGFTEADDLAAWQALSGFDGISVEEEPLWANDPVEGAMTDVTVVAGEVVLEDAAQAFVPDELAEQIVELVDGLLEGQEFLIRTNTATTITLQDANPAVPPAIGDGYRIQTGRGNQATSLRPRARSGLAGQFAPLAEVKIDGDGNVRAGDLVSAGAFEMKDVRLTSGRAVLLEILAGLVDDHLSTVFAGQGGSLDRFTPEHKPASDEELDNQVLSAPIRGASAANGKLVLDVAMGIDQTFRDKLLDSEIDFQDELGIGTEDGRIAIIRSGQRIPLDPLQQTTHEVKVALEVIRS